MSTVRTVVVWWGVTVGLLAVIGITWDAVTRWQQRRAVTNFERARRLRQDRYAANHMAEQMGAARRRHPTSYMTAPQMRKPDAMPKDQYERLVYEANVISLFKQDLARLDEDGAS